MSNIPKDNLSPGGENRSGDPRPGRLNNWLKALKNRLPGKRNQPKAPEETAFASEPTQEVQSESEKVVPQPEPVASNQEEQAAAINQPGTPIPKEPAPVLPEIRTETDEPVVTPVDANPLVSDPSVIESSDSLPKRVRKPLEILHYRINPTTRRLWQSIGNVPARSVVVKKTEETGTHIESGEITWTTAQTVRDIFQNHLDANTQVFVDKLVSTFVDTERLGKVENPETVAEELNEFGYLLYRLSKSLPFLSEDSLRPVRSILEYRFKNIPIRDEFGQRGLSLGKFLDLSKTTEVFKGIHEIPPQVSFKVINSSDPKEVTWVNLDEMGSEKYSQLSNEQGALLYQIIGVKIQDEGSGFDSKLTSFYKTTKTGRRYLRGKYGEGLKMSEAHILRNGARIQIKSEFGVEDNGNSTKSIAWLKRGFVSDSRHIGFKGTAFEMPEDRGNSGSYTLIDISRANERFKEDFRLNIDPRIKEGGLGMNILDYSSAAYLYPQGFDYTGASNYKLESTTGVSLDQSPGLQYVQGLLVPGIDAGYEKPAFSYNFLDSSLLAGRDRKKITDSIKSAIYGFWSRCDREDLLSELFKRVYMDKRTEKSMETNALEGITDYFLESNFSPATRAMFKVLPQVLGLEEGGKYVYIQRHTFESDKGKADLIKQLTNRGYKFIVLERLPKERLFTNLEKSHEGKFEIRNLGQVQQDQLLLREELNPDLESVKLSAEIYNKAREELTAILKQAGIIEGELPVDARPVMAKVLDAKDEKACELEFDANQNKFRLVLRPELILQGLDPEGLGRLYWQRRIQAEMLGAVDRDKPFTERRDQLAHAQSISNLLVEKSIRPGFPEVESLPVTFNYEIQESEGLGEKLLFNERFKDFEQAVAGMELFPKIVAFGLTMNEFREVGSAVAALPADYREVYKKILLQRVIRIGDEVSYYKTGSESELVFTTSPIDSLPLARWTGEAKVYRLDDRRIFLPHDSSKGRIGQGSVIRYDSEDKDVVYNGRVIGFDKYGVEPGIYPTHSYKNLYITIDEGGFIGTSFSSAVDSKDPIDEFITAYKAIEIQNPDKPGMQEMSVLEGTVKTDLSSEYGQNEWDNPVRVFEDILQNHIDASAEGINLLYEVETASGRTWVNESGLPADARIVGFKVTDGGGGYPPNDLGVIGKRSKKSPLFAGKYGEGQKMIAAAAVRNGLELEYSSFGTYNGEVRRWTGAVGTQDELIYQEGKQVTAKRVVFNVNSQAADLSEGYVSSTVMRLPDGISGDNPDWQKWMEVIDPRIKDTNGNGGMARYVLSLREESDYVIDLGYMRVMLSEPGRVYENGLLVTENADTAFGYDVLEVVDGRERNTVDLFKLDKFTKKALSECRDPRLIDQVVSSLAQNFRNSSKPHWLEKPKERDLNIGGIYIHSSMINRPIWYQAVQDHFPGMVIHSKEFFEDILDDKNYQKNEDLAVARMALSGIAHVPAEKIINVGRYEYDNLKKIFPAAEDFIRDLSITDIEVRPYIREALERLTAMSAGVAKNRLEGLAADPEGRVFLNTFLTSWTPAEVSNFGLSSRNWFDRYITNARMWEELAQNSGEVQVKVSPAGATHMGLTRGGHEISFNERLLVGNPADRARLTEVAGHELRHAIFGLHDYTTGFIAASIDQAVYNFSRAAFRGI